MGQQLTAQPEQQEIPSPLSRVESVHWDVKGLMAICCSCSKEQMTRGQADNAGPQVRCHAPALGQKGTLQSVCDVAAPVDKL